MRMSAQTAERRELGLTLLGEPREASGVFACYLAAIIAIQCMPHVSMYSGVLFAAKTMENFVASTTFPLRSKCGYPDARQCHRTRAYHGI